MPDKKSLDLNFRLNINHKEDLYKIIAAEARYHDIAFRLKGSYRARKSGGEISLNFTTGDFDVGKTFIFLGDSAAKFTERFGTSGKARVEGFVKGPVSSKKQPDFEISLALREGSFTDRKYKLTADSIEVEAHFTNGAGARNSTSELRVNKFSFRGKNGRTEGSFSISDFDHPYFRIELVSVSDLSNFKEMMGGDSIEHLNGICHLSMKADTWLDSLTSLSARDFQEANVEGNIRIESGGIKLKGYRNSIDNISAHFRFGQNMIIADSLDYSIAGISSTVSGELHNFLPYLLLENETLVAEAEVYYPDLDLNTFLAGDAGDERKGFILPISEHIVLNLKLRAGKFAFREFRAENVQCEVKSVYPAFTAEKISLSSMGGTYNGWMRFDLLSDKVNCISHLELRRINIHELFRQFGNFGQEVIVDKNLRGIADADIEFKSSFSRDFAIDQKSIEVISRIEVRNGELIGYEPVMALSKYVDVEELKHIKFSKLVNEIEIRDRMVYIPEMEVKSSALELAMSGKHSFDNEIDYHFRLYLNDFLFRKAKRTKKNQEEFGEVEEDESGGAKLFIRLYGTTDNYEKDLDRKAMREKWKSDMAEERKELRDAFRSQFGGEEAKKDVAPAKFQIEWEEFRPAPGKADSTGTGPVTKNAPGVRVEEKKGGKNKAKLEDEYEEYDASKFDD